MFKENAGFGSQYCSSSPFRGADPKVGNNMTRPFAVMPHINFESSRTDNSGDFLVSNDKIAERPLSHPYWGAIAMPRTTEHQGIFQKLPYHFQCIRSGRFWQVEVQIKGRIWGYSFLEPLWRGAFGRGAQLEIQLLPFLWNVNARTDGHQTHFIKLFRRDNLQSG